MDDDDKQRLKLLNLCDPYVAEFFFGGRCIIVEGDTEHTAFSYLRQMDPESFRDTHVIRARGKATIVSLMKILNHFGTPYAVLHDSDRRSAMRGGAEIVNPAWTMNTRIRRTADASPVDVTVVASVPNFEAAFFGGEVSTEKPYSALTHLREEGEECAAVKLLLAFLTGGSSQLPEHAVQIKNEGDLETLGA